ncbi:MAG: HAMP domain-containing histidine kinase [Syntrophales bacterium]|jgi:two-component system sensor histidine kinase BaeS|nr:HAMP domain-containing histidine kinase [Syntrophales bacterium]MCK9528863.1 HAMP domain-containing histidine kinase [Syntrophales bacterium]MDX9921163.1 HAMP domain-containing sensor histidine kinase [Syntrophales bacterium]
MFKKLRTKILLSLLVVSCLSPAAAVVFRFMVMSDFEQYRQGETLDRVQWITAVIEGTYEDAAGWDRYAVAENTIGALMMGLDVTVMDRNGTVIMTSRQALEDISETMRRRVEGALSAQRFGAAVRTMDFPLFSGGEEIGTVDIAFMERGKDQFFLERAENFLLVSLLLTALLAIVISLGLTRGLVQPINRLAESARAISRGDQYRTVAIPGKDEIASLSRAFNRMSETLERQERLRKKLISNVAHELRTPVTAMRSELEAMADGIIRTDESTLKSLLEETGRLTSLIEGIEDLSHAEAGALSLTRETIQLRSFIAHIVDRFRPLFSQAGVRLDFDCHESETLRADPEKLSRILVNLVSNALQATEPGGEVHLEARRKGDRTILVIGDTGSGIDAESLPHVFERFYTTGQGRLGLGLAIVKELVEAHDGHITVESEVGRGTTFTLSLPSLHNVS